MRQEFAREPVFFLKNEQHLGASGSRNRGAAMAKGEYVAFLDADDWWADGKLKKQLALMEKRLRPFLHCKGTGDAGWKQTGKVIPVTENITYRQMLHQNWINCSSVVLRTEVARDFPMEHEDSHEDYITWLKILKKYGTACAVNEPLLKYRLTSTGKSGKQAGFCQEDLPGVPVCGIWTGKIGSLFCVLCSQRCFKICPCRKKEKVCVKRGGEQVERVPSEKTVKVSVIIPVYNSSPYIQQCLDSVTGQSLKELEILCVDDGSSDNSADIVEEAVAKDGRIRLIRQENAGGGAARNRGMKEARGNTWLS